MGIFSFLFGGGKYPATNKYESKQQQARSEYDRFCQIGASTAYKRYEELKATTAATDFKNRVDHLKNDRFNQTEEYRKERELMSLRKSSDIKSYLAFVNSGKIKELESSLASSDYKEYSSLEKTVKSPQFVQKANVKDSAEAQTMARFKELSGSSTVKFAVKTLGSSEYENYNKLKDSTRLKTYYSLEEYVKTEPFMAKKRDLENRNRFKESEEYRLLQEYKTLCKNSDIKWYLKRVEEKTMESVAQWVPSFSDEFAGSRLDNSKWGQGYYVGSKLSGMVYSLADERQSFKSENAVVGGGKLTIQTRAGKSEGNAWVPEALGFVKREYEASSAIINTGETMKQKFGRFDFKVKVSNVGTPITSNIWLSSENGTEINIASFGKSAKGVMMGTFTNGKGKTMEVTDVKYSSDYFIYTLEWTPSKLVWRVNGVEVYSITGNVPQEPMFISMSSNVVGEGKIGNADLSVEWVKVYSLKQ